MLQTRFIVENPDLVIEKLKIKNFDARDIVRQIVEVDKKKRELQKRIEELKSEQNKIAKEIGFLYKQGRRDEADQAKKRSSELKEEIKKLEAEFAPLDKQLFDLVVQLPNLPHDLVPPGKDEADNQIIREGGEKPEFDFKPLPHWELAEKYGLIDFELGTKLTGSGFPVFKGQGARLQRALITYFLDKARDQGYMEFIPPFMVNETTAFGTGQLPDKEGQMYRTVMENFYLIPTAEVPLTNILRDRILDEEELPVKLTAYTPCFRREAGSYGKDVRGLNRVHQFDKVEIVQIAHPDKSYEILDEMVAYVESLVRSLNLPYRIVRLCGGDLSFTSAMTYDFEVYSAGQDKWLEVSSVSNFETFQSNRMKIRFRGKEQKKTQLVHTLNGSALALPRIYAALLENNQTPEGIKIPEVLVPYTGFDVIK